MCLLVFLYPYDEFVCISSCTSCVTVTTDALVYNKQLSLLLKVQQNSSSPTEPSNETAHVIGSAHSSTANQTAAPTVASASLLNTAGVSHAWPHADRRGCRQQCNGPCNVAPESSRGTRYKYVKNGQPSSRAGNSGETKTTVPYHIVFGKKRGASERGVDTGVDASADTGTRTRISTPDSRHSDVRGSDLAVDTTAARQEMEFDVLTLRDLKLQAGSGGRVVPLSETPTDNIKVRHDAAVAGSFSIVCLVCYCHYCIVLVLTAARVGTAVVMYSVLTSSSM